MQCCGTTQPLFSPDVPLNDLCAAGVSPSASPHAPLAAVPVAPPLQCPCSARCVIGSTNNKGRHPVTAPRTQASHCVTLDGALPRSCTGHHKRCQDGQQTSPKPGRGFARLLCPHHDPHKPSDWTGCIMLHVRLFNTCKSLRGAHCKCYPGACLCINKTLPENITRHDSAS